MLFISTVLHCLIKTVSFCGPCLDGLYCSHLLFNRKTVKVIERDLHSIKATQMKQDVELEPGKNGLRNSTQADVIATTSDNAVA